MLLTTTDNKLALLLAQKQQMLKEKEIEHEGEIVKVADDDGELITTVSKECTKNRFEGFVNHYNLTRNKIDCAGLDLVGMLADTKEMIK